MTEASFQTHKKKNKRISPLTIRNTLYGLFFISPWLVALLIFFIYPIFASFYYSFNDFNIVQPPIWVGFDNYVTLITADDTFRISVINTLVFAAMWVPTSTFVGICLALLLNSKHVRGMAIFRSLYFLPVLVPAVAAAALWRWIFHAQWGIVNLILKLIGIRGPGWLSDPLWSKPTLVLMGLWMLGQVVLIYLAGLQDVPKELYEAAEIDGASPFQQIFSITLPMISPVIFFNIVIGLINCLQYFTEPFVISNGLGSPAQSMMFYGMYLYRLAFLNMSMGGASAMAWMLFAVVLALTLILFRTANWWVFYAGSES